MIKRSAMAIVIAALVALITATILAGSVTRGVPWEDVIRATVGIVSTSVLLWIVLRTNDISQPQGLGGSPLPLPPTNAEIATAYFNVVNTYDSQALTMPINVLVDRPHYLERINEIVGLEEERPQMRVATSQVFRLGDREPSAGAKRKAALRKSPNPHPIEKVLLVPLALIEKGTLLDGFTVTGTDGGDVATLSYNQTRGLLAYVIQTIVDIAPVSNHANSGGGYDKIKSSVAARLVKAVCLPGPRKRKSQEEQAAIKVLLDSVNELQVSEDWKKRIRGFCDALVDHYVIVAEVPAPSGGYVIVTYKQAISVDSSANGRINRLRSRFGLRQSTFDIPLNIFALEVDAYHMQMDASPMQYVFDHHLERMNSGQRVTRDDLWRGQDKPYVRLHHSTAGPAMHLYIRRQSEASTDVSGQRQARKHPGVNGIGDRLKSVVEFREIPPGALGAAVVISLITTVVIVFFTFTRIGEVPFNGNASSGSGSDIPALVLALPGFASVIIGSWLDFSHLRRASLATYIGLGTSVLLSLASALYFLLDANRNLPGRVSYHATSSIVIRTDVGWLCLAAVAITSSLFLLRDLMARSRYYFNLIEKRVEQKARDYGS